MPYQPTTNFKDSNGVDLGQKLVTKDYLLTVYEPILDSLGNSNLTVSPALWGWGNNGSGALGVNDINTRSTPVTTFTGGSNWQSVSCGGYHTVAIKTDGRLWTWGYNENGQLGNNTISDGITLTLNSRSIPVTTLTGGTNWRFASGGYKHTAAIKDDGSLWVWGYNYNSSLGTNERNDKSVPTTTVAGGTNWKSVSCGGDSTAAIKTDGTLWLWGYNGYGNLGINSLITRSIPVTTILGGVNWKQVSAGGQNTAGVKTDGTLWIWGTNQNGQLGINSSVARSIPVTTILGGTNWKLVACAKSGTHTAAIKTDGSLWVWGANSYGQLGVNDRISRSIPITTILGGTNWKDVSCGIFHIVAIKTDGSLWCWGRNQFGQLGVNNGVNRSIPVTTILGGNDWKQVSASHRYNTAAIQSQSYI